MLSIANYNMHCGMDGWGRPYDYVAAIDALDADVVVLEEAWTTQGDETGGQAATAARALGYQVVSHDLGGGRRIRPQPGADHRWIPQPSMCDAKRALYMDEIRPMRPKVYAMERWQQAEPGVMGIAVLVRAELPIEEWRLVHLRQLRADPLRRAALVVDLTVDGRQISVAGIHMAHLLYGSPWHFSQLRKALRTAARPDAVLSGDMNAWGPVVRLLMPGWRRAVVGKSWPAWRPHSQIDHMLLHGALQARRGEVLADAGSDHRPIRVELHVADEGHAQVNDEEGATQDRLEPGRD